MSNLLTSETPLSRLDIAGETPTESGFRTFCEALANNTALRELALGRHSSMSSVAGAWLSNALEKNRSLERLEITHLDFLAADGHSTGHLDDLACVPQGLSRNCGLRSVRIDNFCINTRDAKTLIEMLNNRNSRVIELDIVGGWRLDSDSSRLAEAVIGNRNLQAFKCSGPQLPINEQAEVQAALKRNQQLHVAAGNAVHFLWRESGMVLPHDMVFEMQRSFQNITNGRTMAAVVEAAFNGHEPPLPLA